MKLEPVYLVAPKPKPRSMPSRRAFLGMGLAFLGGGAIGSACGYSVGAARTPAAPASEDALTPSGNEELDELRRLATKAPIEELMGRGTQFTTLLATKYRADAIAWRGVDRIAKVLVEDLNRPRRRPLAVWLAGVIDEADPAIRDEHERWIRLLREIK